MDQQILDLFATVLQVAPHQIKNDTSPRTLERWDSMQHLILVSAFEEEFGLDLDPEEAVEMYKDFATFARIVRQRIEELRKHG
jgi:acyl carrier protein